MIKSPFNRSSVFTVDADSKKAVVRAVFKNALVPILDNTDDSPTPSGNVILAKLVAPWKALAPMLVTADGMVIDVKPVIPWKALAPMLVTADGIVIDVKPVIPWKALAPMLVTADGMVMDVKPVIPWKALAPMLVTEVGIVMDFKPVIPWKALAPILATEVGIVMDVTLVAFRKAFAPMLLYVSIITLGAPYNNAAAPVNSPLPLNNLEDNDTITPDFPYNVLYGGLFVITTPSSRVDRSKMAVIIPELRNASVPMLVTAAGMVIDVIPVIPWKAFVPMLLTADGIIIDVKLVTLANALFPISVTETGMLYNVRGFPLGY